MKVTSQLHSQRLKKEMMKSTHHVNQVNKLMSQLTSTKSQLVKQRELFHSTKVARRQVVQGAASQKKLESDIKYLNGWLIEMYEKVKDAKRMAKETVKKSSKSSVIMYNRIQRLKDLEFLVGELKE